ncbi:MAG: IS1634 family transposase [Acidimicrobiales bacterium]
MYLRETSRRRKDGSLVTYLQLAHNERHPVTGSPVAKVIHNFGRADKVDKDALRRLVSSISRVLGYEQAGASGEAGTEGASSDVEVVDARRFGGAYVLDRLWERLGIGRALVGAAEGRRLDAVAYERVVFALVANRCLEPTSKLAATKWAAERVGLVGCPPFDDDGAYASMDFFLDALGEVAAEIFSTTANLLNLSCDVIFVDTSSTYFEVDVPDDLVEVATAEGETDRGAEVAEGKGPEERATRRFSKHSKDHRPDLPQVVLGLAVTAEGIPVRCWTFPGTTSDQVIIKKIKDDLSTWRLNRVVFVADSGFNSAANRAYLERGGSHYVVAEPLRRAPKDAQEALKRAGRYHKVEGNLEVKEVVVGEGSRRQRFCVCHNPEVAARDRVVRENLVRTLEARIAGSDAWSKERRDELVGELRATPALRRLLRRTKDAKLRLDKGAIANDARFDGKFLLRSSDDSLTPTDLALAYKQLTEVERGWRDMKGALKLRPVFHYREDRIRAHVQLCWLGLLLIRTVEHETADTWRNVRHELDRMHLVILETPAGRVTQRSATTQAQQKILAKLGIREPARYLDFELPPPVA